MVKKKGKRKPSAFNRAVGKFRKQGKTFKQSVRLAKASVSSKFRRRKSGSKRKSKTRVVRLAPMARRRRSSGGRGFFGISQETINDALAVGGYAVIAEPLVDGLIENFAPNIAANKANLEATKVVGGLIALRFLRGRMSKKVAKAAILLGINGFSQVQFSTQIANIKAAVKRQTMTNQVVTSTTANATLAAPTDTWATV